MLRATILLAIIAHAIVINPATGRENGYGNGNHNTPGTGVESGSPGISTKCPPLNPHKDRQAHPNSHADCADESSPDGISEKCSCEYHVAERDSNGCISAYFALCKPAMMHQGGGGGGGIPSVVATYQAIDNSSHEGKGDSNHQIAVAHGAGTQTINQNLFRFDINIKAGGVEFGEEEDKGEEGDKGEDGDKDGDKEDGGAAEGGDKASTDDLPAWPQPSINPLGQYHRGAVAAGHGRCSEVGRDILIKGGNAIDAAIAAMCCIEALDPQSAGLGGGFFMSIFDSENKECRVIDAREVAPAAATEEMFNDAPLDSTVGWKAIAVPGFLHGIRTAFDTFGSGNVTWAEIIEPTISILKEGIPCSGLFADRLHEEAEEHISTEDSTLDVFINPKTGKVYEAGDIMYRPELLKTYEQLAESEDPIDLFYNGEIAQNILKEFQEGGGIITAEDLAGYKSLLRPREQIIQSTIEIGCDKKPVHVCALPPPSSGAVIQSILKILTSQDISPPLETVDSNVDYFHKFIEAMKFAYATRSRFGDIDFTEEALLTLAARTLATGLCQLRFRLHLSQSDPNAHALAKNITSDSYVEWVKTVIKEETSDNVEYYGAKFAVPQGSGTAHVSVMDEYGNAVSATFSINLVLGSKRRSRTQGIVWNNHMDDFSKPNEKNAWGFAPSKANFIAPGKRMQSSMSPTVIWDEASGKAVMAVGGTGGSRIISGVANVAARSLVLDQDVKTAVDRPRLHNQLTPIVTQYDPGFPESSPPEFTQSQLYVEELKKRQHDMEEWDRATETDVTAVRLQKLEGDKKAMIYASSDFRKGPQAYPAGY